jgi:D-beta-D-heptose 7-phosphate kinase/D-beta-D-heptose 1-phosphate adenosyltransferase
VSDYGKGVLTARLAQAVIGAAGDRGVPVVVDPRGTDYAKYRGATLIKPNSAEVGRLFNEDVTELGPLQRAGHRLARLMPGTAVLITCGRGGMLLFREGAPVWHMPAAARQVCDVTGAGDTVVSAITLALAAGAALEQAIELANEAAGIAVSRCGTAAIGVAELRAILVAGRSLAAQRIGATNEETDPRDPGRGGRNGHAHAGADAVG